MGMEPRPDMRIAAALLFTPVSRYRRDRSSVMSDKPDGLLETTVTLKSSATVPSWMPETTSDTVVKKNSEAIVMTASEFLHILFFCGQAGKKKEEGPVHLFKSRPHRIPQWRLFCLLTKQRHTRTHPVGTAALFPAENDKAPDQSVGHPVTEFLWM